MQDGTEDQRIQARMTTFRPVSLLHCLFVFEQAFLMLVFLHLQNGGVRIYCHHCRGNLLPSSTKPPLSAAEQKHDSNNVDGCYCPGVHLDLSFYQPDPSRSVDPPRVSV